MPISAKMVGERVCLVSMGRIAYSIYVLYSDRNLKRVDTGVRTRR